MEEWLKNFPDGDGDEYDHYDEVLFDYAELHPFCLEYSSSDYYVNVKGGCEFPNSEKENYYRQLRVHQG